jgi:methylenetetrahydrofolate dehydrogenase (NADP+) / methenyltetrahydrofolate cyclohydrolase
MEKVIDGKLLATKSLASLKQAIATYISKEGRRPGLAVVLVGDDPASEIYVRNKVRQAAETGIHSFEYRLPAETEEEALLKLVQSLNDADEVDGILVQLPLPPHIDSSRVLSLIAPGKDVDGFHPVNVGHLASGTPRLVPCTPRGCMHLIESVRPDLHGLEAVIVGRSNVVGRPMAQLLLLAGCTVTIAHSRTEDLPDVCRRGDILVAAAGRPKLIRGDWIKPGAIVIDVGINRVASADGGRARLVGDVDFEEAIEYASVITPVPGGVGPMTIAMLLSNTLNAARFRTTQGAVN